MITDIIKSTLLELGCNDQDISVYQLLLQGINNVTNLSKSLSVNREKIYSSIQNLQNLGLVIQKENYSRRIEVVSPMHILSLLKVKVAKTNKYVKEFGEILPDILLNFDSKLQDKQIQHYSGENDFIKAFDELLTKPTTELLCFISPTFLYQAIDISFLKYWINKRVREGVKIKILAPIEQKYIYNNDQELHPSDTKLRQIKYFDSEVKFQGTYCICNNKTYFFNPILLEVFVISDKIISDTHRASFELIWLK